MKGILETLKQIDQTKVLSVNQETGDLEETSIKVTRENGAFLFYGRHTGEQLAELTWMDGGKSWEFYDFRHDASEDGGSTITVRFSNLPEAIEYAAAMFHLQAGAWVPMKKTI